MKKGLLVWGGPPVRSRPLVGLLVGKSTARWSNQAR
jgi:hypothetical protein